MAQKILVIDDSNTTRASIAYTLTKGGYEVILAESGEAAIPHFDNKNIGLIITDINMPGMSGIDVVKNARSHNAQRHTPILVLTTESQDDMKQQGKEAGATGWLVKPFKPEQLIDVAKRFIR